MRLSEIKGEEALEVLADILEPTTVIMTDKEIVDLAQKKKAKRLTVATTIIRKHPKEIIEILAGLDRQDTKTYEVNLFTLPLKVLEILNDPDLANFFQSQGLLDESTYGSASESTEE